MLIKNSWQQKIHLNGNVFRNKCCRCNEGSLYFVQEGILSQSSLTATVFTQNMGQTVLTNSADQYQTPQKAVSGKGLPSGHMTFTQRHINVVDVAAMLMRRCLNGTCRLETLLTIHLFPYNHNFVIKMLQNVTNVAKNVNLLRRKENRSDGFLLYKCKT